MSDLVKKDDGGGLLGVLHGTGGLVVPKPFEREIYLFTTHVAGTTHVDNIFEIEKHLNIDDKLLFFREDNPHDNKAIRVETLQKKKLAMYQEAITQYFQGLWTQARSFMPRLKIKRRLTNGLE